jgi:formylglycine-generating enzyme required for sulfatase activity
MPLTVAIPGGDLEVGFRNGVLRKHATIAPFSISRYPTTVQQYRTCVDAGGCQVPPAGGCNVLSDSPVDGPNYGTAAPDVPVTCVGPEQAKAYCAWVGGALPTPDQWLAAARGTEVRRWPWGATAPNCEQHPLGAPAAADSGSTAPSCDSGSASFAVGRHPRSASPAGVEDVLLTRSELVRATPKHLFQACSEPSPACGVHGLAPGAIDAVEPVQGPSAQPGSPTGSSEHVVDYPYSFRCAWSKS